MVFCLLMVVELYLFLQFRVELQEPLVSALLFLYADNNKQDQA